MFVEIITVRTVRAEQCAGLLEEMAGFRHGGSHPQPLWCACYQNLDVENELSVHLGWEDSACLEGKTARGLQIAAFLVQHGLVHHTLWKLSNCFHSLVP
jgi:hypothetical protein